MAGNTEKFNQRYAAALDAAAAVFAEKGYHGASTANIAERMSIKQGSLYYYFPSKDAALSAICLDVIDRYICHLNSLLRQKVSCAELLGEILRFTAENLRQRVDYSVVFFNERRFLSPSEQQPVMKKIQRYQKKLLGSFRSAQRSGELQSHIDAVSLIRSFIGQLSAMCTWYQEDSGIDIDTIADVYLGIFLRGVINQEETCNA